VSKSDFEILRRQSEEKAKEEGERNPSWNFKKDPVFEGTVVRGKIVHANDKMTPIIIADQFETDERYTIWCGTWMLAKMIDDEAPKPGSLIVVEFLGAQPTTNDPSRKMNTYSMAVSESDPEYWAGLFKMYYQRGQIGAEAAQHNEAPVFEGPDEAPFAVGAPPGAYRGGVFSHMTRGDHQWVTDFFGT
jgi:hypothetical protein